MAALPGNLDDWTQDKDGGWFHPDHPEAGITYVTLGGKYRDFADLFAKRALPDAPPPPDPRDVKIAALEARLDKLDGGSALTTRR